jgi:serine/threonine protein kinase
MAHNNRTNTTEPCPFRIPTAPGKSRAPEEYNYEALDEKLDMYSVAHVLYGILTGGPDPYPWSGWSSVEVKKTVQKGLKPLVDEAKRPSGSTDEALHNLMLRAYEFDPKVRISATELVQEIERLL